MPNGKLMAKARKASDAVRAAELAYHKALAEAFPIGMRTHYARGYGSVSCEVVGHVTDRLRVKGQSGLVYLIHGPRFH
jgi:hypothetical protein